MSKIESVKGWLKSIDTGKRTLTIQIGFNAIPVSNVTGRPTRVPETRYPYKPGLYEDTGLVTLLEKRVQCRLEDGIVVNVGSFS